MQSLWNAMRVPLITIVTIFLCLFLYTKIAGPIPFAVTSVQTTKSNLFQVTGTGKATAIPNTATFQFGVTKTAGSVGEAQKQTNTAINSILKSIKTLGIDTKDIKTINYSVFPQYNYTNQGQVLSGYSVTQNIEVKLSPIDKATKAVDLATNSGANILGSITFVLDDKTQKQLETQARQDAVNAAKAKAESLAKAAGIRLGRIIDIQETPDAQVVPLRMDAAIQSKGEASNPTQLPAGENSVSTSITLSYETY